MGSGVTKTLTTSPDERGMVHRVIIKDAIIEKGSRKVVCPGRLLGSWRAGDRVVVKMLEDAVPDEQFWLDEISKCNKLREYIIAFRKTVEVPMKFHVEYPMTAYVDKVSKWMKHKLNLKSGEFVLVEEQLGKEFSVMLNTNGKLDPLVDKNVSDCLSELMHFTYHDSCRKELFCGFQGVVSDSVISLAEPTVHSVDKNYRDTDLGLQGILLAFDNHRCTARCRGWLKPESTTVVKTEDTTESKLEALGHHTSVTDLTCNGGSTVVCNGHLTATAVSNGHLKSKVVSNGYVTTKALSNGHIPTKGVGNGYLTAKAVSAAVLNPKSMCTTV